MRKLLVILGVPVDNLTMEEALARCDEFIADGRAYGHTHQIATVNADFVVNSLHDPELRRILQEAHMATADGMPLVWASRLLGGAVPGRVTGADLVPALAERAAERGYSIFFLGAKPGVADRAAQILAERFAGLKVAGILSPPPASVLDMDRTSIAAVKEARPDILLVAFGNPKQEKWIRMHAHELKVPICIGIGGTLDMIAGITQRAPLWMQRSGLEWVYRLAQEPRRLAKRYLHDFGYFGYFFLRQWWAMRRGTAVTMLPSEHQNGQAPVRAEPTQPDLPNISAAPVPAEQHAEDMPVLRVQGRLDVTNQTQFVEQANAALDSNLYLVVDLAGAHFLDSSALGALVALANRARSRGGDVYLVAVPKPILSLLELVHLDQFFEIFPSPAEATQRQQSLGVPTAIQDDVNGWSVIHLPRLVDAEAAHDILERSIQRLERSQRLILDCSDTVFLASAGMAMMLKIDRMARERGGMLRIAACSPDVQRTLELVKLDNMLALYADVVAAVQAPVCSNVADTNDTPLEEPRVRSPLRT